MTYDKTAYELYRKSFPSDAFLSKYFGADVRVEGNPHRAEIDAQLYESLRYLFDGVLRASAHYLLQPDESELKPVYVFKEGRPEEWVDPLLESRGLMLELSLEAFLELAKEFIFHSQAGAFHHPEWWQWRTEGDSLWLEIIPAAIAANKHKRQTLSEMLAEQKK